MPRSRLPLLVALALVLIATPRRAHADELGAALAGVGIVVAAVGADVAFTAHDIGTAGRNEASSGRWLLGETIVTSPQALVLQGVIAVEVATEPHGDAGAAALLIPATWISALAVHGGWGLGGADGVEPGPRLGLSWLLAADLSLTSAVAGTAVAGRLPRPVLAVAELALTAPQVALGVTELASGESHRAGWAVLTAWSGALLAHGATSLALGVGRSEPRAPSSGTGLRVRASPLVVGERGASPGLTLVGTF